MINKYSKIAGYEINLQKFTAFLYTNKYISKKEMRGTIPFAIARKNNKMPRNKLHKACEEPKYRKLQSTFK